MCILYCAISLNANGLKIMSFNKTSLNKIVVSKILNGCKDALSNDSGVSYINNKKGNPFLRIKKVIKANGKTGFEILDNNNNNIASVLRGTIITDGKGKEFCGKKYTSGLNGFMLNCIVYNHQLAA